MSGPGPGSRGSCAGGAASSHLRRGSRRRKDRIVSCESRGRLDAAGRVRMMGGTAEACDERRRRRSSPVAPVREGWRCPVVLERLHAAVAALFVVAIVVQVFLAGAALANLGGSGNFATHIEFGYTWIGIVALAVLL